MLSTSILDRVLERLPSLHIGVVGDLFLDRYLDLDARLTEPSVETGLDAYQVVGIRCYPGAAGTVLNNLAALGVGRVSILSVIGDDGEGFELRRALTKRGIDQSRLLVSPVRFTPTYTKPMLGTRELNRLDIKNHQPLPPALEDQVLHMLPSLLENVDALLVLDQVREPDTGVITARVRERLAELGGRASGKFILADSRERIGEFRHVAIKPNERELAIGFPEHYGDLSSVARLVQGPVLCTRGELGIRLATPGAPGVLDEPGYSVSGPIDPVGAGDSTSAGIASTVAAGCSLAEAAAFGNLVASITIQQLGTTGTATPAQVRERWSEVSVESTIRR
jgi:rfaE bifunctional protein kinase chain/domain